MDKKQSLELCAALSNAKGAPGFEDEVLTVLRAFGAELGDFREDSLRNLYLSRQGNKGSRNTKSPGREIGSEGRKRGGPGAGAARVMMNVNLKK